MEKELAYWIALTHIPKIRTRKKHELIHYLNSENKTIIDFFHSDKNYLKEKINISEGEILLFEEEFNKISNYSFLVEDLLEQGYSIIPINHKDYSKILKNNMKLQSPIVIYTKGNKKILEESSIAIVGSRKANDKSLIFTDKIAEQAKENWKVVVSGFAKGVDRKALDCSLKYKGQSIIVLPQGICTFESGFKQYYKEIVEGDLLVLSTFYPKARWSIQFAMARNPIIYGLASEIYVAESDTKGGTWSGVMDGLRKKRKIYIRIPNDDEKNANNLLIEKGGIPINNNGEEMPYERAIEKNEKKEYEIIQLLKNNNLTTPKIIQKLKISKDWKTPRQLTNWLKEHDEIIIRKKRPLTFTHKDNQEPTLF